MPSSFITLTTKQKISQSSTDSIYDKMIDTYLSVMLLQPDGSISFIGSDTDCINSLYSLVEFNTGFSIEYLKGREVNVSTFINSNNKDSSILYNIYLEPKEFHEIVNKMSISAAFKSSGSPFVCQLNNFKNFNSLAQNFTKEHFYDLTLFLKNFKYKPEIYIDCDMVLLDFNECFYNLYSQKTGIQPLLKDSKAFKCALKYDIPMDFIKQYGDTEEFWGSMPVLKYPNLISPVDIINELSKHFTVNVLTTMKSKFKVARIKNLWNLDFNISSVICTDEDKKGDFMNLILDSNSLLIDDLIKNLDFETKQTNVISGKVFIDHSYSDVKSAELKYFDHNYTHNYTIKNLSDLIDIAKHFYFSH